MVDIESLIRREYDKGVCFILESRRYKGLFLFDLENDVFREVCAPPCDMKIKGLGVIGLFKFLGYAGDGRTGIFRFPELTIEGKKIVAIGLMRTKTLDGKIVSNVIVRVEGEVYAKATKYSYVLTTKKGEIIYKISKKDFLDIIKGTTEKPELPLKIPHGRYPRMIFEVEKLEFEDLIVYVLKDKKRYILAVAYPEGVKPGSIFDKGYTLLKEGEAGKAFLNFKEMGKEKSFGASLSEIFDRLLSSREYEIHLRGSGKATGTWCRQPGPDGIIKVEGKLYFYDDKLKHVEDVNNIKLVDDAIDSLVKNRLKGEKWIRDVLRLSRKEDKRRVVELVKLSPEKRCVTVAGEVVDEGYAYGRRGLNWHILRPEKKSSIKVYTDKIYLIATLYDNKGNVVKYLVEVNPENWEWKKVGTLG